MAYVIDSPNQRKDSYVIHTQPTSEILAGLILQLTSAEVGDEWTFHFHHISNKEVQETSHDTKYSLEILLEG